MDRAQQTAIISKLFAHIAAGTTDMASREFELPVSIYDDADFAGRERRALFRQLPLIACHSTELKATNDFVTVSLAGVPVLVVRQADGSAKAFTNVCRHRGSRLEAAERGNRRLFVCPFHAWSYDASGELKGVPCLQGFDGMDRGSRNLTELPVEERHGLVWVVPTAEAPIDVAKHLGAVLDRELSDWKLSDYVFERVQNFDVPVNWKLLVDGFMEDYHLPVLHKNTIGPYFAPNLHTFDAFDRHGRMIAARANIEKLQGRPPGDVDLLRCSAIVYQLFPSGVLVWQNDHFELWNIFPHPTDHKRSIVSARLLAPSAEMAVSEKALWDRNWKILMDTVEQEDWVAARDIQEAIRTGGQSHFIVGRNEPALQHFHQQIGAAVASV